MREAFSLHELVQERRLRDKPYLEFLRVPALSMGMYVLLAGDEDPQSPHTEDEVYYVVTGRALLQVGEEHRLAEAGCVLYVPAGVENRFHTIVEDLTVLVFFAPAEGTSPAAP